MRLFTSYKIVSICALTILITGCSSTFDENNNYVTKDVLHKQNVSLFKVNNDYINGNNLKIEVIDKRPFKDTVALEGDSSIYFIDLNQDDTAETREKTVGYMLTTFTGFSNVVMQYKISDVIKNYVEFALEKKLVKDKNILVKINDLWESPSGTYTNVLFNIITNKNTKIIDSVGYRYSIDVNLRDFATDTENSFICENLSYRDNVNSVDEEEISSIFSNMMNDVHNCILDHL